MHHVDVFVKFRDDTGSFNINLSNDPRGLLSLYNAAHMAVPGEMVLATLRLQKANLGLP